MFEDVQTLGSIIGGGGVLILAAFIAFLKYSGKSSDTVTRKEFNVRLDQGQERREKDHAEMMDAIKALGDEVKAAQTTTNQNLYAHATDMTIHGR